MCFQPYPLLQQAKAPDLWPTKQRVHFLCNWVIKAWVKISGSHRIKNQMLCTRIISIYTQKASRSIYTALQHTSVWVVLPDVTQKNRNEPQAPAEGALSLNLGCVGTSCPATIPLLISWSFSITKERQSHSLEAKVFSLHPVRVTKP